MNAAARRAAWSHLRQLATEQKIKLHPTKARWQAEAHISTRQVFTPRRMTAPIDYLVALHEFGHILSTLANHLMVPPHPSAEQQAAAEGAAWSWAFSNAEPELLALMTATDWALVGDCMVSHIRF